MKIYAYGCIMVHKTQSILHIEDDPGDALLTQEMLQSDSSSLEVYEISHVDNLKDALKKLSKKGYSAVLLDLNLKDSTGPENIRALKRANPEIPIIILTGVDDDQVASESLQSGAQNYLVKGHSDGCIIRHAINSSVSYKAIERQLFRDANYDDLTGFPNHRLFQDYLDRMLADAQRYQRQFALLFLDLNEFKHINDDYGHEAGNLLLKLIATRIQQVMRKSDMIARYGGDEFVILLNQSTQNTKQSCITVANKILHVMHGPYDLAGKLISVSVSIGISVYPEHGDSASKLIQSADQAMYRAKGSGKNQYLFAN